MPRKRHHVHEHAPIPAASSANVWPRGLFAALHHVSEVGYVLSLRERRCQMLAKEFQGLLRIGLFPVLLQRGLILPALEHHELVLAAFHLEYLELVVARLHPCEADAWHHLLQHLLGRTWLEVEVEHHDHFTEGSSLSVFVHRLPIDVRSFPSYASPGGSGH